MGPNGKHYLAKFYEHLQYLPEEERLDAVREIESNITTDGIASGQPEAAILDRLGSPSKLAKVYQSEYITGRRWNKSVKDPWDMLKFYCTTGLLSIVIIPVLATIAYGFGFTVILVLVAGVIRSFGVPWINMNLWDGYEVPYAWSIPYALALSAVIGGIALTCRRYLFKYLAFLSREYSKLIPGAGKDK